jgi:hypothetical protein
MLTTRPRRSVSAWRMSGSADSRSAVIRLGTVAAVWQVWQVPITRTGTCSESSMPTQKWQLKNTTKGTVCFLSSFFHCRHVHLFCSLFYYTFSVTRLYSVDDRVLSEWWIDEDKHPCLNRDSNPMSQLLSDQGLRLRPRGFWNRLTRKSVGMFKSKWIVSILWKSTITVMRVILTWKCHKPETATNLNRNTFSGPNYLHSYLF